MQEEQAEDELYGLLAEWIALCVGWSESPKGKPNEFRRVEIYHWFSSSFERAVDLMLKLGLYKKSKKNPHCYFQFDTSRGQLAKKAVRNRKKGPSLKELLTCFLDLAGQHHGLLELKTNKAFKVHSDRDRIFDLFMQLDYVRRQGVFCYWTPKIEAAMDDKYVFYERKGWIQKEPFR